MNLKKSYKKVISLIILLFIINLCKIDNTLASSNRKYGNITKDVVNAFNAGENININKYNLQLDKEKSEKYNVEEVLAIGYYAAYEKNEEAEYYLEMAYEKIERNIPFDTKYMILYMLVKELVEKDEIEKAIYYLEKVNEFSVNELERNIEKIKQIFYLVEEVQNGRSYIIDILEKLINNNKLSLDSINAYRNFLGIFYVMDGRYSNGAEMFLLAIDSEESFDSINSLKSIIDLGTMFTALDKYDVAEETYLEAIKIAEELNKDGIYNMIMLYGYINLYEVLIYQNKIDDFLEIAQEIEKYYEGLNESLVKSTIENHELLMASAYISKGELEKADQYISHIDLEIKNDTAYLDDYIFKVMILGDYYYAKGNYDEAICIYESVNDIEKDVLNKKYEKMLIARLAELYEEIGDKEKELVCRRQLLEIYSSEAEKVSDEYIEYIINKYSFNKKLVHWNRTKVILASISSIICAVIFMLIIGYLKQRKVMRLDGLTGLYKREYFDRVFQKKVKHEKDFIMIIFDIDDFKFINDTYGHAYGDEVLRGVAQTAKKELDKKTYIFRYGGEEFVVISEGKTIDEGVELAERIRASVEALNWSKDKKVTISIGVSARKSTMEAIFETADNNLYRAKRNGKNQVAY